MEHTPPGDIIPTDTYDLAAYLVAAPRSSWHEILTLLIQQNGGETIRGQHGEPGVQVRDLFAGASQIADKDLDLAQARNELAEQIKQIGGHILLARNALRELNNAEFADPLYDIGTCGADVERLLKQLAYQQRLLVAVNEKALRVGNPKGVDQ